MLVLEKKVCSMAYLRIWKQGKERYLKISEEMKNDDANNNIHDNDYQFKFAFYRYGNFYLKS